MNYFKLIFKKTIHFNINKRLPSPILTMDIVAVISLS